MEINKYIKQWSEKLSISEEEIKKEFNTLFEEEKTIHADMSEEEHQQRAIQRLAMTYKKQLRSPAVVFEGMLIGASDCFDYSEKPIREAKALFREEPSKAIEQGITDIDGNPLDVRKVFSTGRENQRYGTKMPEHNYSRTVYGIATKRGSDTPKFFTLNMNGEIANSENLQIFKPVIFKAIDKSTENDSDYKLNSSTFTKFDVSENLDLPTPEIVLEKFCKDMKIKISTLDEYHENNATNYNRLVLIEADVETLNLEPNSVTGSRRMVIDDEENSLDLDSQGITCWLPKRLNIDFAEGSKIIIAGRTGRGKKRDENGNVLDEPGDITINTFGVYAIPKFKVSPEVEPLTEDSLVIKPDNTIEDVNNIGSDDSSSW